MLALFPRVEADVFSELTPVTAVPGSLPGPHVLPVSGTLGSGVEFRYRLTDNLNLRYSQNTLDLAQSQIRRSIDYDLTLNLVSHPVILDWHPFGGRFRASTGVVLGAADLRGTAYSVDHVTNSGQSITGSDVHRAVSGIDPSQTVSIGQWTIQGSELIHHSAALDPAESLTISGGAIPESELGFVSAKVRYPKFAPYLGFGWGNGDSLKANWLYSIDVGVMFLGRPKVEMSLNGAIGEAADRYYSVEAETYLAGEREKLISSLQKYRYFPVFSISLWYRF